MTTVGSLGRTVGGGTEEILVQERGAFIVEGVPISAHLVEPDGIRRGIVGAGETQDGGGHTGVGLERAGRELDHGIEALVINELLPQRLVGLGAGKQDTLRDDNRGAAAEAKEREEAGDEEELRLFGGEKCGELLINGVRVHAAGERWVGKDNVENAGRGVLQGL